MTLKEIEESTKNVLVPTDIAEVLGCNPYSINVQAYEDPVKLGFPVIVIRRTVRIPRIPFIAWIARNNQQADKPIDAGTMTADEAVRIGGRGTVSDGEMIHALMRVFECRFPRLGTRDREDDDLYLSTFFATVWNAGRVQGIRDERKRRRLELAEPD